jgi:hypothetical protein
VFFMNPTERQSGRKAQQSNIAAAKTVADVIRTCLGPRAMLKMLLDPMVRAQRPCVCRAERLTHAFSGRHLAHQRRQRHSPRD